jgi:hypothetical protein
LYGEGFILTAAEREGLLARDARAAERIWPYIGGQQFNSSPTLDTDEYALSFGQLPLSAAEGWPELLQLVRERVKPERDKANDATADGAHRKKYWWQFAQPRPDLYVATAGRARCIATARDPQHIAFAFQPTTRIFNEKLTIVASEHASTFAVLQSRIHVAWVVHTGRTTGAAGTVSYSSSDCFDTFPFPQPDPRTVLARVEATGQVLYDARAEYMVDTQQGLTKTYNALKDSSCTDAHILELRRLHEAMDRAVLDAYGWTDIAVPPYCPVDDADKQAIQAFEDEVIDRLYVLNAERARDEERLGVVARKAKKARSAEESAEPNGADEAPAKPGPKKKALAPTEAPISDQGKLFE